MVAIETHEVLISHDLDRGPLTSVRRMLVHSSIAELKQLGLYERYRGHIDPASLTRISELIGPGWMPVPPQNPNIVAILDVFAAEVKAAVS